MLDNTDKKWITETIDEKLNGTKTELRGEMQGMKAELREEMQGMKTELREEMQGMKTELREEMQSMKTELTDEFDAKLQTLKVELTDKMDEMKTDIAEEVSRHVMVVFENTYQQYVQLIGENIPDLMRAFNNIREQQERHQASIELLNNIVKDLDHRVTVLEHKAM